MQDKSGYKLVQSSWFEMWPHLGAYLFVTVMFVCVGLRQVNFTRLMILIKLQLPAIDLPNTNLLCQCLQTCLNTVIYELSDFIL